MAITSNDIKLFQAQDNTDNDSGGGSRTNTEIVDGDVNNLFPDISRIDTVSGDVALRKVFPTVTTNNQDVYYGAHAMIRKVPTDPKVSALIFHTDDPTDTRIQAQDKIESYVVASYKEEFWLFSNHVKGAKSVTFLQRLESQTPDVGEVYLLKEGEHEQFIRIASIQAQEVSLSYTVGNSTVDYTRRRIICEIDQALEYAFTGSSFHPSGQIENTADTWATQVADASKFYSTKTLTEDAVINDVVIKVDSIFEQIVPASKKQTPIINQEALIQGQGIIGTGVLYSESKSATLNSPTQFSHAITPGSITKVGQSYYVDDGKGNIINTNANDAVVGSVDYKNGIITQNFISGGIDVDYEIASTFNSNIQFTGEIQVTQENIGNVFVRRLSPLPSIGDLYIDYRSNGKWYRFASTGNRVGGNETIGGDSNIGSGALNDNYDGTGTISITLAALPDIDSSVIISWGSAEKLNRLTNADVNSRPELVIPLGKQNIDVSSFAMQVHGAGYGLLTVTANANGSLVDVNDKIQGFLDKTNGKVHILSSGDSRLPSLNSSNVVIDFDYSDPALSGVGEIKTVVASRSPTVSQIAFGAESGSTLAISLGESVIVSSLAIELMVKWTNSDTPYPVGLRANESGQLILSGTNTVWGTVSAAGEITLDFGSKVFKRQLTPIGLNTVTHSGGGGGNHGITKVPTYMPYIDIGTIQYRYIEETEYRKVAPLPNDEITIRYTTGVDATPALSHNITGKMENIAAIHIATAANIVGSLSFAINGAKFSAKGANVYNANGAQVGIFNASTGDIVLNYFGDMGSFSCSIEPFFTDDLTAEDDLVTNYTFRTASTKLTTSSFSLSYQTANGTFIATTDNNGVFTGTDIDTDLSYVNTQTGMATVYFTSPVFPESLKYDAVAESSLPLDPELLGLNPVRLPADGRVPVFKPGYHLVIFNEATTATTNPTPLANDVETLARTGQAHIEVVDANGKRLNPVQYIADRTNGTVTFSPTLVLEDKYNTALTAPFYIVDRIEDMVLATDVQINGLISLSAGLSHNYTQGVTKVASSLVWGDTGARVYNLFTQEIWDSGNPVWSDNRIGDNTTAQYDNVNSPIQIDNKSSTPGRWAIIFRSSSNVDVVHEKLGVVASNITITIDDVMPINPATGEPYFTMFKAGFGSGWVTNNVIRFNTDSGDNNMWVIRTVQSGALSELTDSIDIEVRGDAN